MACAGLHLAAHSLGNSLSVNEQLALPSQPRLRNCNKGGGGTNSIRPKNFSNIVHLFVICKMNFDFEFPKLTCRHFKQIKTLWFKHEGFECDNRRR